MSILKEKLTRGETALGTHITLNDHVITEIVGSLGYDYLWIDTEHTAIGLEKLEDHLIAARAAGVSAIVRVPSNDPIRLKPVLEMGPDGVIIPMVNSLEEAERAMRACLYPPRGVRGYGPRHAARFGLTPLGDYLDHVERELLKMVQIEHIDAVRDLARITSVPEIDAFIIGPRDLAASIGKLADADAPELEGLFQEIIDAVHAAGKPVGVSYGLCTDGEIAKWFERGVDMISIAAEMDFVISGAGQLLRTMKRAAGLR